MSLSLQKRTHIADAPPLTLEVNYFGQLMRQARSLTQPSKSKLTEELVRFFSLGCGVLLDLKLPLLKLSGDCTVNFHLINQFVSLYGRVCNTPCDVYY